MTAGPYVEKATTSRCRPTAPGRTEEAGRDLAKNEQVEFMLHGADGKIREKDSYGNDPRNAPG